MKKQNIGGTLESFFEEMGELEEVNLLTQKKIIAHDIQEHMRARRVSKAVLADRMGTSRAQIDRLLDASNTSVTLATLARAAAALGLGFEVRFAPVERSEPRRKGGGGRSQRRAPRAQRYAA